MKTYREILEWGRGELKTAGVEEYELDAWYLFEDTFGIDRAHYFMIQTEQIKDEGIADIKKLSDEKEIRIPACTDACEQAVSPCKLYEQRIRRRAKRIPLQHITGKQEFMGLPFLVSPAVLIPRQDTETLVEAVLEELEGRAKQTADSCRNVPENQKIKLLDMCTGSGCIVVSIVYWAMKKAGIRIEGVGADISPDALSVAERNESLLADIEKDDNSISWVESDLFKALDGQQFDMIVSNPPYIATKEIDSLMPEVRDYEPMTALDGHEDGLYFYRRLAEECISHLKPGGSIYFEIGYDQGEAISRLLDENGYREVRVLKDAPGLDRVVTARRPLSGQER